MKAEVNSGNCEIHMNHIKVVGDLRNDCLIPLIAIFVSNNIWGTDVCQNYSVLCGWREVGSSQSALSQSRNKHIKIPI